MKRLPLCIFILFFSISSLAADKAWQNGTLLGITTRDRDLISTTECQGQAQVNGTAPLMPCVVRRDGALRHYARIRVGDFVYIGTWQGRWDWSTHGDWSVNTVVQVRFDKNAMYVRWATRKQECKMDVVIKRKATGAEAPAMQRVQLVEAYNAAK